ncbi:GNAT family N-acetyltransferase [Allorhizobium borbori]|uniref:GNAT superfamily N-acetyltransferase n=1 Tax=Allorhizobium borbori TaxID=485907 RepID=A0A7W6K537_9HYPH|nr:GNAT family N-acetyltransferase [Allorhizobium borbori]MBB4105360.1 GNAT superfamily N-acetyltransferase [Allorhizobium borbori]
MTSDNEQFELQFLDGSQERCINREARDFCLEMIRQTYAIDYHAQWHADLDALLQTGDGNWYAEASRGAFCVVYNASGNMIATGGLHGFSRKPGTVARLGPRYDQHAAVCQLVRVYLAPCMRGKGLGTRIVTRLEETALKLGYQISYLHADALAASTLRFWEHCGYREFGRFSYDANGRVDMSVDFDKPLC